MSTVCLYPWDDGWHTWWLGLTVTLKSIVESYRTDERLTFSPSACVTINDSILVTSMYVEVIVNQSAVQSKGGIFHVTLHTHTGFCQTKKKKKWTSVDGCNYQFRRIFIGCANVLPVQNDTTAINISLKPSSSSRHQILIRNNSHWEQYDAEI